MTRFGATTSSTDVDPWTREKDLLAAIGVKAITGIPTNAGSTTSQTVSGAAVYLYNGETVTNIISCVQTAATGAAPTGLKLALWDSASTPNCLAVTTDLASDARWTSQGWKVSALTSPYAITVSGAYYLAFWQNGAFGGTNLGLVLCTGSIGGAANQIGSGVRLYTALKTGATTMAASDTGTYSQTGAIPLLACS